MNHFQNIWDFQKATKEKLDAHAYSYLDGGADDLRTFQRNINAFQHFQIRPRRLVDVRQVDTNVEIFGKKYSNPIYLSPVGFQQMFHPTRPSRTKWMRHHRLDYRCTCSRKSRTTHWNVRIQHAR